MTHKITIEDQFGLSDGMSVTKKKRMILNPNKDVVLKIIDRIYKCEGKCPCQPQDPCKDTKCPCPDFITNNECHCHLFVPEEDN